MKLVDDVKNAWKWFSVQAMAAVAVLPVIWSELPAETKTLLPTGWTPWIITAVAVAGLVGRVIDQGGDK